MSKAVPMLRLYFLGTLDIRYGGQQLPKPATLKSQSLLAYVALNREHPQISSGAIGRRPRHAPPSPRRFGISAVAYPSRA